MLASVQNGEPLEAEPAESQSQEPQSDEGTWTPSPNDDRDWFVGLVQGPGPQKAFRRRRGPPKEITEDWVVDEAQGIPWAKAKMSQPSPLGRAAAWHCVGSHV